MSFKFLTHLILRCPRLSYKEYDPGNVGELLTDDAFLTSISLSSQVFYNALKAKGFNLNLLDDREKLTLQNYYNRMSFRTTPFGAFSSFTYSNWAEDRTFEAIQLKDAKLHLLPDQQYLQLLTQQSVENLSLIETYIINPTLYKQGHHYRFIKTTVPDNETAFEYSLQTFQSTRILSKIISAFAGKEVKSGPLLLYIIEKANCREEEATGFISFLDDSQIILRAKFPGVLGAAVQQNSIISNAFKALGKESFPQAKAVNALENYLKSSLPEHNRQKLRSYCYVNLQRFTANGLDTSYQKKLAEVIEVAKTLMLPASNELLKTFAEKFEHRFEKRAVPLLQALDPITGVSYGSSSEANAYSTLLDRIQFKRDNPKSPHISWTAVHNFFLKKLMAAPRAAIQITDHDLDSLRSDKQVTYPTSFSIVFNIVNDVIITDGSGGISANALIGRFTPFNHQILESAKEVARLEALHNPDVIFAEINHLSDSHVDNINRRCPVYDYEIPVNAMPVEGLKQIALTDLYVRVINGDVVLESKSLKKRVIPRLTSAYNYQRNDLSLFRFLSDLQYQGICYDFEISIEKFFPDQDFYPRIEYKGAVLSLAKWVLSKEIIKQIAGSSAQKNLEALDAYRQRNNIPDNISVGFSDKQLFFDLSKDAEAQLFIDNIKADEKAIVREFIRPETTCASVNGKPLINQFIAFAANTEVTYRGDSNQSTSPDENERNFSLGSEWLYLKIYCSTLVANELLTGKIVPLMDKIIGKQADKWFFVRYYDSGHHIRLRIHTINNSLGDIITELHVVLQNSLNFHLIREYQADTYHRELERYGIRIIETIETVFFKSSVVTAAYLKLQNRSPELYSYYAYAFLSTMKMLTLFMPDPQQKAAYTDTIAANFIAEFKGGKQLKVDLDKKYREVEQELASIVNDTGFFNKPVLKQKQAQFEESFIYFLNRLHGEPQSRQRQLVADAVHMHLNRAFSERQRNHELVIYYCLSKKFKSDLARLKHPKKIEDV